MYASTSKNGNGINEMEHSQETYPPQSIEKRTPFILYFADIEYFVNSCYKFLKLCTVFSELIRNDELNKFIKKHKALENTYREIRNAFEHIDERILNDNEILKQISSIGDDTLETSFGNIRFKPETLETLYLIYDEILSYIQKEYIIPRQEWYDAIWGRSGQAIRTSLE